jgi:FAD/FMN-containing dehydrogenase
LGRGAKGFTAAAEIYNERFDSLLPNAVARPLDAGDVRDAVRWLISHGVPMRARSGGHSYAGYSTREGGVVLDLRNLSGISVDRRAGTATIGAGAQLIDVYRALNSHGVTIPAGSCPSVGIAGKLRTVDSHSDPGLLWALRGGGGGNFGVVTKLKFRVHSVPASASWFVVRWPWSSAGAALDAWLRWAPHVKDAMTSVFHLETGPRVLIAGQYLGPAHDLGGLLAPMASVAGASVSTGMQSYFGLMVRWAGCTGQSLQSCHTVGTHPGGTLQRASFDAKSDYLVKPLSASGRAVLTHAIELRQGQPGSGAILFDAYGGAINRVAPGKTAFVHRNAICCIQYLSYNGGEAWLDSTYASMRSHVSGMAYQNYIDHDLRDWRRAYYGSNYRRLVGVQRRVDPHHYFNFAQAIGH